MREEDNLKSDILKTVNDCTTWMTVGGEDNFEELQKNNFIEHAFDASTCIKGGLHRISNIEA